MIEGGKAIAAGGYGCVFKPALKCKNKDNRTKGVSKLLKKSNAEEEYEEALKVSNILKKSIPNYNKYVLLPEEICEPDVLEKRDLINFDKKCEKFTSAKNNLSNFKILNMPFGGDDLGKYLSKNELAENFIKINNSLIDIINNAVVPYNKNGLVHLDLKAQNLLINSENLNCKIIDWGLLVTSESIINRRYFEDNILEDLEWRPIQFNAPPSNILFSEFYSILLYDFDYKRPITEIAEELETHFPMYKKDYRIGHFDYMLYCFKIIMNNLNMFERPEKLLFLYMAKCVKKFKKTEYDETFFDKFSYYNNVYKYNADIWGILTVYVEMLFMPQSRVKLALGKDFNNFKKQLSSVLFTHMIETCDKKIDVSKLSQDLSDLNTFFKGSESSGKSLKPLKSTTPEMITVKPSDSVMKQRLSNITNLSKSSRKIDPDRTITEKYNSNSIVTYKPNVTQTTVTVIQTKKRKRCPKGTRRNHRTGECQSLKSFIPSWARKSYVKRRRCPKGTRRNKKNGECEKKK